MGDDAADADAAAAGVSVPPALGAQSSCHSA